MMFTDILAITSWVILIMGFPINIKYIINCISKGRMVEPVSFLVLISFTAIIVASKDLIIIASVILNTVRRLKKEQTDEEIEESFTSMLLYFCVWCLINNLIIILVYW